MWSKQQILVVALLAFTAQLIDALNLKYKKEFESWFNKYRTKQDNNRYNITTRQGVWEKAHEKILKHNERAARGLKTFTMKHNKFSDLTPKEFAAKYTVQKTKPLKILKSSSVTQQKSFKYEKSDKPLPKSVDWMMEGYVNPAPNQGSCGSCYVFAGIASLEGQVKKYFDQLPKLSDQQATSCCQQNGCQGGWAATVYNYLNVSGGSVLDVLYPYTSGLTNNYAGKCASETIDSRQAIARVQGTVTVCGPDINDENNSVECKSESELQDALANVGPLSVGIYVDDFGDLQYYAAGVFTPSSYKYDNEAANHDVTAIGYGTDSSGSDYYIIRNSWGTDWGNNGLALIARNKNFTIGIGQQAYYPLIDQTYAPPPVFYPPVPQINSVDYDSLILNQGEDYMLVKEIGASKLELLYRGSRDGFSGNAFHKKCDGKEGTLTLIKVKDNVFGGYTSVAWDSTGKWKSDSEAFIFSLRRGGQTSPVKLKIDQKYANKAIKGGSYHSIGFFYAFQFGEDLKVVNAMNNSFFSLLNQAGQCKYYECPEQWPATIVKELITGQNVGYNIEEIEVFQLKYSINE